jgi:hypothetical protein
VRHHEVDDLADEVLAQDWRRGAASSSRDPLDSTAGPYR